MKQSNFIRTIICKQDLFMSTEYLSGEKRDNYKFN